MSEVVSTSALNYCSDTVDASDYVANSVAATLSVFTVQDSELIISEMVSTSALNSEDVTKLQKDVK